MRLVWAFFAAVGGVDSSAARRPSRVECGDLVLRHEGPGRRSACSGGLWRVSRREEITSSRGEQKTAFKFTSAGLRLGPTDPPEASIPEIRASCGSMARGGT